MKNKFAFKISKVGENTQDNQDLFESIYECLDFGYFTNYFLDFFHCEFDSVDEALEEIKNLVNKFNDVFDWLDGEMSDYINICIHEVGSIKNTNIIVTLLDVDGKEYKVDYGYDGYFAKNSIWFSHFEHNQSCDCNKRIQINRIKRITDFEFEDFVCGEEIEITNITVEYEL